MQRRTPQLAIAFLVAIAALISYFGARQTNPVTGEKQHIGIDVRQESALGLQAAPQMEDQYGGESRDASAQARVDAVGQRLLSRSKAGTSPYKFDFHVLADPETINAFALPGGQVFITQGLLRRLKSDGEVAGVLGHEIGHVVGRHGAEHLAKAQLSQGLTGAAVLATYDPDNPSSARSAQVAAALASLIDLKYGRNDELEADKFGVDFMADAGYDPRAMLGVMETLKQAGGGRKTPEFFSTHPNPDNRTERIKAEIAEKYPQGIPNGLER